DCIRLHSTAVAVSSKTGGGLDELGRLILSKLGAGPEQGGGAEIVNARHADELRTAHAATAHALAALQWERAPDCIRLPSTAVESVETLPPPDLVIAPNHLREAAEALGRIIGRVYADDLLDTIFSRFCVGK
ncbi:MAG: hypothetical protein FWH21_04495, partial [Kiritimatiellaeota bacterium]|nr:hypothetical protein [Kiritimatiellota bacterium]